MKLKILFFPLVMIASLVLFITNIWPGITEVRTLAAENKKLSQELDMISEKRNTIRSLDQALGKNIEKENIIKSYLPQNKNEEKIIDAANFLAAGAGVSLINVSIEGKDLNKVENREEIVSGGGIFNPVQDAVGAGADAAANKKIKVDMKKVPVIMTISGNYENLKGFLVGLNKMGLMNDISVLKISSTQKDEDEEPGDLLSAEISGEFYYLEKANAAKAYGIEFFNFSDFDFSQVDKVSQAISQGVFKLEVGEKGSNNPFIAR